MATAADHKIIIEKGADFKIDTRVTIDGINAYNLGPTEANYGVTNTTGYIPIMCLMYNSTEYDFISTNGSQTVTQDTSIVKSGSNLYLYIGVTGVVDLSTTVYTDTALWTDLGNSYVKYVKSDGTTTRTKTPIYTGSILTDGLDGNFSIILDDAVTSLLTTYKGTITSVLDNNPFATEYNYFYYIELTNTTVDVLDIRVLRGKAAVRV